MILPLQWLVSDGNSTITETYRAFGAWCRNLACMGGHQTYCVFTIHKVGLPYLLLGLIHAGPLSHDGSRADMIHCWKQRWQTCLCWSIQADWKSLIATRAQKPPSQVSESKSQTCNRAWSSWVSTLPLELVRANLLHSFKIFGEKDLGSLYKVAIKRTAIRLSFPPLRFVWWFFYRILDTLWMYNLQCLSVLLTVLPQNACVPVYFLIWSSKEYSISISFCIFADS